MIPDTYQNAVDSGGRVEFERVGFDHSALANMLRTAARFNLELHVFIPPSHAR
jgi:hypothetical protein